jgi:hypothetical protein
MSPLPPEILDLIVGFLHDEPDALKACCLTSKSWVHRTREHLFACVKFDLKSHIEAWKKTFPDPSNSPARYTRSLSIHATQVFTSVGAGVGGWILTFSGVVRLYLDVSECDDDRDLSLVPLRGLSPTLETLYICYGTSVTYSEIFGLVCSFPLLEDLALVSFCDYSEVGRWSVPSTSPKLTGCLTLAMLWGPRSVVHRLLELPGGLHFSKIVVSSNEDIGLTTDLISKCSGTLECLNVYAFDVGAVSLSIFVGGQYLTAVYDHSRG